MSGERERVISVAELDRRLRCAVEGVTGDLWVEGEIGSLKRAASGHFYFTLKDETEDAIIDCVMYRYQAQRAQRFLEEGARLLVLGKATVWAPRGRLQLVVERARPQGRGALLEALERLRVRLAAEGLFAPERKRPLPPEPRVVGVVTSAAGAALRDICSVAFRRGGARIVLAPALVQGEGAPDSILSALDLLERHPDLDVAIVGRGGGSIEDLMAFNDERVVRRIARCRVPVVSAVGHEIDFTLADLAADVRAATPSQAAELVVSDASARIAVLRRCTAQLSQAIARVCSTQRARATDLRARLGDPRLLIADRHQRVDELMARMERRLSRDLARQRAALEGLNQRLATRHPRAVVARGHAGLEPLRARLHSAARLRLRASRARLDERVARLDSLSPLAVLGRGYAIAAHPDGRAIRAAREVGAGDRVAVRLHRGGLDAQVTTVWDDATREPRGGRG